MATYLIGVGPEHLTETVTNVLADLGSFWQPLPSVWLLHTATDIPDVFEGLKGVLGGPGGLLIIDVTERPRMWSGFPPAGSDWMDSNYE